MARFLLVHNVKVIDGMPSGVKMSGDDPDPDPGGVYYRPKLVRESFIHA
jgi:hypothetical protein